MQNKDQKKKVPFWRSCRVSFSIVCFMGCINVYMLRTNLSVAMVCMRVNDNTTMKSKHTGNTTDLGCEDSTLYTNRTIGGPKVPWDSSTEGAILSSFFYGYICTQLIGGYLSGRFGGKIVFGIGMTIASVATFLTPIAITYKGFHGSPIPVIVLRIILGLASGVVFPSTHNLLGKWAPPLERSKMATFVYSGVIAGTILGLSLSGVLCEQTVFADGWPSIFYVFGGMCCLALLAWFYVVYDYPCQHPRITSEEREYIEETIGAAAIPTNDSIRGRVPWKKMLFSLPVWGLAVAHFIENWNIYTLSTKLPTYMNDVLKYNIRQNGLLSSLPYVVMFIATLSFGLIADCLRERNILSTTAVRKLFQCGGFIGIAGCLVATGYIGCDLRLVAVAMVTIGVAFTAGSKVGCQINHIDIAPKFAGELYGITNTFATIPGMISPIIVSELTPNGTRSEWKLVFYIWTALVVFGALFYGIFGTGEEQDWAKTENTTNSGRSRDVETTKL